MEEQTRSANKNTGKKFKKEKPVWKVVQFRNKRLICIHCLKAATSSSIYEKKNSLKKLFCFGKQKTEMQKEMWKAHTV